MGTLLPANLVGSQHFYRPASAPIKPSTLPPTERCRECGMVLKLVRTGLRICFLCERVIIRHEKFIFTRRGVRHRNCSSPESYCPVEPEIVEEVT